MATWQTVLSSHHVISRTHAISQLVSQVTHIRDSWLRLDPWRSWCRRLLTLKMRDLLDPYGLDDPNGECPAKEVMKNSL